MALRKAKRLLQEADDYLLIAEHKGDFKLNWASEESFGLLLNVAINSPQFRLILASVVEEAKDFLENMPDDEE
jgi:hypothetical protein